MPVCKDCKLEVEYACTDPYCCIVGNGKIYRPSNGTEGADFMNQWCCRCERDREYQQDETQGEPCEILGRTFSFNVEDAEYPREWCYKDGKPTCTDFVPAGDEVPRKPCPLTEDMFK